MQGLFVHTHTHIPTAVTGYMTENEEITTELNLLDGFASDLGHDGALSSQVLITQAQEVVNNKRWRDTEGKDLIMVCTYVTVVVVVPSSGFFTADFLNAAAGNCSNVSCFPTSQHEQARKLKDSSDLETSHQPIDFLIDLLCLFFLP